VGAGVTVGESHERDRTTINHKEREEVIIKEHDRD
jgi:hypothetical protein